ncbi:calcium-activated chloride channel regulator 3A-1-like [Clavelina lepadiformis]|uniref:calcium-activated chloride channel regulator 3A-1-like n=1 Tax=Clavelina lepadiformis TaxID=159417 RepID=UPI0040430748
MLNILLLLVPLLVFADASMITLANNRYEGLVIAINPEIAEDPKIIDGIKSIMTDASSVLFKATDNRAYFGEITILVPEKWTTGTYKAARNESYGKAGILVASANPKHGDEPYTMQYGECGEPGEYIHITPDFILNDDVIENYGPKGKTMIHEWAHFRWGVFDESATEGYDPFYYASESQNPEATRCPVSLKGTNVVILNDNGTRDCQYNGDTNWLPEDGCVFIVDSEQPESLNASLMSHQYLDQVLAFCHSDESDPVNLHNHEAPNEHNRLCNQRSVWDVMLSSIDFKNKANLPQVGFVNPQPTFKVIQPKTPRYVLVLDTSGSMNGINYDSMMTASSSFISYYVPDKSAVGIVEFNYEAQELCPLIMINTQTDRNYLLNRLPSPPDGGTAIGRGILKGIETMTDFGDSSGGHLIVLTDGQENVAPYINEVREDPTFKSANVIVDSVFFGTSGSVDLQKLSDETGGRTTSPNDLKSLIEAFQTLSENNDGDIQDKQFQIFSGSHFMNAHDFTSGMVVLDSTVGKNTLFGISWSQYPYAPDVVITNPTGEKYCSTPRPRCDSTGVSENINIKTINFQIPGVAKAGNWIYEIRTDTHSMTVNVLVTSQAADKDVPPIVVESSISSSDVSSGSPLVVNAKVSMGYEPILKALVTAKITSTDTGAVHMLDLYDGGSAPDVRKNDGIYSRYVTEFSNTGRYSVQVSVQGFGNNISAAGPALSPGSPAAFNFGHVDSKGNIVLNPAAHEHVTSSKQSGTTTTDIDPFTRIDTAGAFFFSETASADSSDLFPPSRVIDLTVKQVDALDVSQGVLLTFTSPGDDYDAGTANSYEIRYTYGSPSSLSKSFTAQNPVKSGNLISGDLTHPSVANSIENFVVNLTDIPTDKDLVTVAFALRATDDDNKVADVSNIAMMNLFLKPPAVSCSNGEGSPISSIPFEKKGDCKNFYQCSNGDLYTLPCKENTVFNPSIGVCDRPENVPSCSGQTLATIAPPTGSSEPPPPSCSSTDGMDLLLPIPGKCNKYYQCNAGILIERDCPPGLVFNPDTLYCDWTYNVPGC